MDVLEGHLPCRRRRRAQGARHGADRPAQSPSSAASTAAPGYISYAGDMDLAIAIRTAIVKDQTLHAGGGRRWPTACPRWKWKGDRASALLRASEAGGEGWRILPLPNSQQPYDRGRREGTQKEQPRIENGFSHEVIRRRGERCSVLAQV